MLFKVHSDGRGEFVADGDDFWDVAESIALDEGVEGQDDPCWEPFSFTIDDVEFVAELQTITEFGGSIEVTNNETGESRIFEL